MDLGENEGCVAGSFDVAGRIGTKYLSQAIWGCPSHVWGIGCLKNPETAYLSTGDTTEAGS